MIIDFHTHIFPPEVRTRRDDYIERDITFAEMYTSPKAKVAIAEDLAASMEANSVDTSIALGFAWRDHDLIVRHNDYLLETAMRGEGRILPFATVNMTDEGAEKEIERMAAAGARGLGELRPESQGWDLNGSAGERLAEIAGRLGLILLFHVTEPAGRQYPGKYGLSLASFVRFASAHRKLSIVGAHPRTSEGITGYRGFVRPGAQRMSTTSSYGPPGAPANTPDLPMPNSSQPSSSRRNRSTISESQG